MTKVIILNSGIGSRMGNLTVDKPKCLIELDETDTILSRQLKALEKYGFSDVLITTGPFESKLQDYLKGKFNRFSFNYVNNPLYRETNYIYSLFLLEGMLTDDVLLMHGDMVFDESALGKIVKADFKDAVLVNPHLKLPEKDFKAEIKDGLVKKVSVDIFSQDCVFLLPIYKLTRVTMAAWMQEIVKFTHRGALTVYAENALNNLLDTLTIYPIELKDEFCMEIDDAHDLQIAKRYLQQRVV